MKALSKILAILFFASLSHTVSAQAVKKTTTTVKREAKKVGNKSAEIASKGKATITDQVYKGKAGPAGQTIYIDDHSRYYWIDKKGHRNYVTENELTDKIKG